jgi:putative heme-binding domain-containing protein
VAEFYAPLLRIGNDAKRPKDLRVAALAVAMPQLDRLEAEPFTFLRGCLAGDQPALLRLAAAEALGEARLNREQLEALAGNVAEAGPLEVSHLVTAFAHNGDARAGRALVVNLAKSPGLAGLAPRTLRDAVRNQPDDIRRDADALLKKFDVDADKQRAHLAELQPLLDGGDADRGRIVFFSGRTACSACHTVHSQGGRIGPELSKISSIRAPVDLLESLVYPSATIARGYESYVVETTQGKSFTGLLARETTEAIYLTTADRAEIRIPRASVDAIKQSKQSIMPAGLEAQMTKQEMRDLLAFLRSLK